MFEHKTKSVPVHQCRVKLVNRFFFSIRKKKNIQDGLQGIRRMFNTHLYFFLLYNLVQLKNN